MIRVRRPLPACSKGGIIKRTAFLSGGIDRFYIKEAGASPCPTLSFTEFFKVCPHLITFSLPRDISLALNMTVNRRERRPAVDKLRSFLPHLLKGGVFAFCENGGIGSFYIITIRLKEAGASPCPTLGLRVLTDPAAI